MMLRRLRPGLHGRLVATVVLGTAVALAVLIATFNFVLGHRLEHDAADVLRARTSAELAAVRTVRGRLSVPEAPDAAAVDAPVWVFAGRRVLERPRTNPRNDAQARGLVGGGRRQVDVTSTDTRLYAVPVVQGGRRIGTVVSGVSLAPYEHTRRTALVASLVLGLLLLGIVAVAARLLVSGALRPVARMTAQAEEWSERSLHRRFAMGDPHDELSRLAATLDGLLGRVAASLQREQTFSAELSHELRTPLANVVAEAQLALRRDRTTEAYRAGFEEVLTSARRMQRTLDALISVARAQGATRRATSDAYSCAVAAAEACAPAAGERGLELDVDRPGVPLRVAADADLVERTLVPVIENACRYGQSLVRLGMARNGSSIRFTIEDDGPGVSEAEQELIFEPGRRGASATSDGAGLGLPLSRRLAVAAGGEVQVQPSSAGGRFVVRLPVA